MTTWEETLKKITDMYSDDIKNNGFTPSINFKKITKDLEFTPTSTTPYYVSLDFWLSAKPSQEKFLRSQDLYILRTGEGHFSIIDGKRFPKPYLNLDVSSSIDLHPFQDEKFASLEDAVKESQENIGLEQLHYFGIYQKLVDEICGKSKYHIGPRGGRRSSFDVFAKDNLGEIEKIFHFDGSEELDYTLWTRDTIFMIEAKSTKTGKGLDIGWHKIAYPASRFRKYAENSKYRIIPVYLLRWDNVFYLFIFSELNFYKSGIVINDSDYLKPKSCYRAEIFS